MYENKITKFEIIVNFYVEFINFLEKHYKTFDDIKYIMLKDCDDSFIILKEDFIKLSKTINYIESPVVEKIYMGLPLNTEYRVFVDFDTKTILSDNQYWDKEVMNKRFKENRNGNDIHDVITYNMASERLEKTYADNISKVRTMVQELLENNVEMTGQWSIDIMQVEDDFYLIDMALAENSFYYNSVPKELRKPTTEKWLELQ